MHVDNPIEHIAQDRFGREPIVGLIVDSINALVSTDHSCMVYGIYGKWGEGKSSLMNFVKECLLGQGKYDGINIVEFNPWLVNNDEALLQELFKSMVSSSKEQLGEAFAKYGSLAIFASKTIVNAFVPGVGTALADCLAMAKDAIADSQDSLAELKKNVSKAIKKSGRHLVVFIDDVDRLDKEELHTLLRIIRQVADFDNCIYIVAMDVDMVAKSISDYHGNGSVQDGRKFLDKIVQVPITLPQVPAVDMFRFISQELSTSFDDLLVEQVKEITEVIIPFIGTYRDLKRYCNQMKFVYPHLKGEVNVKDLFLLEAVKMVNAEAYQRIHECRSQLMHESWSEDYPLDAEKSHAETEMRYREAKAYITSTIEGPLMSAIDRAIDVLFDRKYNYQDDVDAKRLLTDVYFSKYYTQLVPSDIIPDKQLEELRSKILELEVDEVVDVFNTWGANYSVSEVKRAAIYVIRKNVNADDRCRIAVIMAKAMSVCSFSKGVPPHIYVDVDNFVSFVPVQIISPYMFFRDTTYGQLHVYDASYLDDTLSYIFKNAEINYCINMLCSSDNIFDNGVYNGSVVLSFLFERFKNLDFEGQIKYSKFLLQTIFKYWQKYERDSFNEYAEGLFSNPEIPYLRIFDKLIDGTNDTKDVVSFVKLFSVQISVINERLQNDEPTTLKEHHSVKIYSANCAQILENHKL